MKPRTIKQRAASYASGKRTAGTHTFADEISLEEGWEAGYRRALLDVKNSAALIVDDIEAELTKTLSEVARHAAERFREELNKIE